MRTLHQGGRDDSRMELKNAANECKAERADDPDGFDDTYGIGKNGCNALGKRVSSGSGFGPGRQSRD